MEAFPNLRAAVEDAGNLRERLEVLENLFVNVRPLHLDDDRPSVAERRSMHLTERRGRQRRGGEVGKRLGDPHTELFGDDALDVLERKRCDVVL